MDFPIDIRRFLPHRKPMLMVDEITCLNDEEITTTLEILEDNIFLENGALSEIGIIENAAQTSSGIIGRPYFDQNEGDENYSIQGYISKIKSVEIFNLPLLNKTLTTHGRLISSHPVGDIFNCDMICETYCDDVKIAESSFNLIIHV
ncbi:MAG: ABC transporter permease [Fluviicola sp.]|nr:MAG: ABC transporter permease [Fluviicola sp.]